MKPIFGFALLRNGIKYDYPFMESLLSLGGLCEKIYLAMGKSDDGTEAAINKLKTQIALEIVPTVWDENFRKSGLILSQQTNIALSELRKNHSEGWAFYLQADEVIAPQEYPRIKESLALAAAENADSVTFRYLHFWHSYHKIAYDKRWYPHEVRAIKLDSTIESYGDAQSFLNCQKRFFSDAHIFHYGHVRESQAYARKQKDFHRWWHSDQEMPKILARGIAQDKKEKTLDYLGPHPTFMKERIIAAEANATTTLGATPLYIIGDPEDEALVKRLGDKNLIWKSKLEDLSDLPRDQVVLLRDFSLLDKLKSFFGYAFPKKMARKDARPWTREFLLILKLSEKGYFTRGF